MNLKKIIIKNFKKIGSEPVTFEIKKGLNLIRSEVNGTGKTTLLSAITFLLWGKNGDTKGNTKTTLSTSELINDINKKELLVEGHFDNGYVIRRGLKPNIFEILDEKGENLADRSSKTIDQDFLETELLGYNYETFMSTIFLNSKPNSIPFIYMSNTQRKEYIEKILDLRVIYFLNESLKTKINLNKSEIIDCLKTLEWNKDNLNLLNAELNRQKLAQENQKKEIEQFYINKENQIKNNQDNIKSIEERISQLHINHDKLNESMISGTFTKEIEDKIKNLQININEIQISNDIELSTESAEDINLKLNTENEILNLKNDLEQEKNTLLNFQNQLDSLNNDLQSKDEQNLKNTLKIIEARLQELQNEVIKKETQKEIHFKNKDSYSACGSCPTLSTIIGVFDENEYNEYILKSKNIKEQLNTKYKEIEESIKSLDILKNDISLYKDNINNSNIKINKIQNNISSKENILKDIEYKCQELKNIKTQKIKDIENQIQIYKMDIQSINDKIKTNIDNILNEISDKQNQISIIEQNIESIKNQNPPTLIEINEQPVKDCQEKILNLENQYDILNNQKIELDSLKESINSKNIKEQALKSYIPIFEEKVNTLISRFTEDDMFTVKAKLTDDFDIVFTKNGKSLNMFSLSEGQKASITFAFTFAFQFLLDTKNQIKESTLFIDEILDIALSSGRLNTIIEYLKEVSASKSVYIISHNSNIQLELFDNIIDVSIEGGFSKYSFSKGDE